jgi:hypothetical protein
VFPNRRRPKFQSNDSTFYAISSTNPSLCRFEKWTSLWSKKTCIFAKNDGDTCRNCPGSSVGDVARHYRNVRLSCLCHHRHMVGRYRGGIVLDLQRHLTEPGVVFGDSCKVLPEIATLALTPYFAVATPPARSKLST